MIRALTLATMLVALAIPATAHAQTTPAESAAPATLDWMVGEWSGKGKLFGRNSEVELTVRPVAAGAAYSLDYRIYVAADGDATELRFAAHGFFQRGKGRKWHGRWVDNFGNLHDISGTLDAQAMTTVWGSPSTEIGRSSYSIVGGQLQIVDWALGKEGSFNEFARSKLNHK
ncbi:hypothetical protein [Sphingorhabdus sp.]|uniref:hypothetical protein n=1 Tax=Sphingorhabdus sp. TaxID=1902408 RepID=UPI0032B729F2